MKTIKFISRVGTNAEEFRKELAEGSIEVLTMFICNHADGSRTFFVHEDNKEALEELQSAEIFKSERRGRKPSPIPLEQRKELYDETQKARLKAKREEARVVKSSGDYSHRRMHFLFQIFDDLGLNMNDVASRCPFSQQALSAIKIYDDTKLKNVHMILGGLGLSISPKFKPAKGTKTKRHEENPMYTISGNVTGTVNNHTPEKVINDALRRRCRLSFLAEFLNVNGISLKDLSKSIGISVQSLRNSFTKDNISVSTLYRIAESYNQVIDWVVTYK